MKITAWDILSQSDGDEYAENIKHKLIEDIIDQKKIVEDLNTIEPVQGRDVYEKLYELEKRGWMLVFEKEVNHWSDKYPMDPQYEELKEIEYDYLDMLNRRNLLESHISTYDKTDSYDNMQEALDKYEDALDAANWAVLSYAIIDGQIIRPDVLPIEDDRLTMDNLEYFMEWATRDYISEVVSEVAYNMRGYVNLVFDHDGRIDMEHSEADKEILEDVERIKNIILKGGEPLKESIPAPQKHSKEQHESLKNIWLNGVECPGEFNNSHVSVVMMTKDFSGQDKEYFEDLILDDQEKKPVFGGFGGAFYADVIDKGNYKLLSFELHKGDFEAAKRLSKIYPDAVVFVNDDWDIHSFAIFKDGEYYDDYTAAFEGDEPKPYEEDGEIYYDVDMEIDIKLPFSDQMHTCYSGGGMCTENEFKMYKEQVERHTEREDVYER